MTLTNEDIDEFPANGMGVEKIGTLLMVDDSSTNEYRSITLGEIADKIKELLADRGVEVVVVVLPDCRLEAKRYPEGPISVGISEVEPDGKHRHEN